MLPIGRDQPYSVISGPSFAREMMLNHPTAVVAASKFLYHAVSVQRALSSTTFKVFTSQDLLGVQLAGALKNPLAIGAGVIEGLELGINTLSFYITRSSIELMQLCKAMGGDPGTISGATLPPHTGSISASPSLRMSTIPDTTFTRRSGRHW